MKSAQKPIVTICSSANFYKHAVEVKELLEAHGLEVIVPHNALQMQKSGDFDVLHYKTWFGDENDYHKKAKLMRMHFDEITRGTAVLIINDEKHGKANYIGPNVLMEMSLAFYQQKPIFILGDLPTDSPFEEELKGMMPILLHGNPENLLEHL